MTIDFCFAFIFLEIWHHLHRNLQIKFQIFIKVYVSGSSCLRAYYKAKEAAFEARFCPFKV